MKENVSPSKQKASEESLRATMQEGKEPSVEQLMLVINRQETTIKQLRTQLGQAAEACRDMQIRLATTEFQHRLDFLWKVMFTEGTGQVFGKDFLEKCAQEFKEMMFPEIPETSEPDAPENKK